MKKLIFYITVLGLLTTTAFGQTHFTPVGSTGLPYAVVIQNATLDGDPLASGDEIAVFDGELCVGAAVLDGSWPVSITAWEGDPSQSLPGFTSGHTMEFIVWTDAEYEGTPAYLTGDGTFGNGFGSNISILSATTGTGGTPDIDITPVNNDFGSVEVGESASLTITVSNNGDAVLNLLNAEANDDAFTIDEPSDTSLDPDQEISVDIHFAPLIAGDYSGTISITSSDPDESPFVLNLSGTGTEIIEQHFTAVEPTGLPYAIVIQNAELDEVQLVSGDEIGVFDGELCVGAAVLDGSWPVSITAWEGDPSQSLPGFTSGHAILFKVYSTDQTVEEEGTATYQTGDGTFGNGFGSNVSILTASTGSTGTPDIDIVPSVYNFGYVYINQSATTQLTISNDGDGVLYLIEAVSSDDVFTIGEPSDISLDPEQEMTVDIHFAPLIAGDYSGTISITSNDPDESPFDISVSGVAIDPSAPHFTPVSPTGLPYAIVVQEAVLNSEVLQPDDEVGIYDGELCVGSAILDGSWPISITAWEGDPSQSLPGFTNGNEIVFKIWVDSEIMELEATPVYQLGDGTFGFGFGSNISILSASTSGLFPDIHIENTSHDFGEVTLGNELLWITSVDNLGDINLIISDVFTDNASFTTSGGMTVAPDATGQISITFSPTELGELTGNISVISNDPDEPEVFIQVSGTAVPVPECDINLDETNHNFGMTIIGGSKTWNMSVENEGNATLTITEMVIQTDLMAIDVTLPLVLEADSDIEIPVSFTPVEFQTVHDTIMIVSDDPDEDTLYVSLVGEGLHMPSQFSLVAPDSGSIFTETPVEFNWSHSFDGDPDDFISYYLEISENENFSDFTVYSANQDSFVTVNNLLDDTFFFWRVRAFDTNSDSIRYSNEIWTFLINILERPISFNLLAPVDSTVLNYEPPMEVDFLWEQSFDHDPESAILYTFYANVVIPTIIDTTILYEELSDTTLSVNIPDSLGMEEWNDIITVNWWVEAISQGDTTESEDPFRLYFQPSSNRLGLNPVADDYAISRTYPNPFNPTLTAVISLPMASDLTVQVFNVMGQRVAELANGEFTQGYHSIVFDGTGMASGVYFIHASVPGEMNQVQKVILMK